MNKKLTYISLLTGLIALTVAVYLVVSKPKIGYVNNNLVMNSYYGVKESEGILETKIKELEKELKSLEKEIDESIKKYQIDFPTLDNNTKISRETHIKQLQQGYFKLKEENEKKIQEEDQRLTKAVLTKINSFMEEYGKKNGFDVIIGVTDVGNVLYANESLDITDTVIKELNKEYEGEE